MPTANGSVPVDPALIAKSVETLPPKGLSPVTVSDGGWGLMMFYGAAGQTEFPAWGTLVQRRDMLLREFLPTEPFTASAFSSVISRYASAGWELEGPPRTSAIAQQMLQNANLGKGWTDFASQLAMDLLTQDKGAFVELIRAENVPTSPVLGIRVLDALRCWSTGRPESPVIFADQLTGKYIELQWFNVVHLREMPMSPPLAGRVIHDLQMCALSRALLHSRTFRSTLEYMDEKVGGRHTRAIHVLSGVAKKELEDAMELQQNLSDQRLLKRYSQPVVITAINPESKPQVATLELSSLPEGHDGEKFLNQHITLLAIALLTDYQDLAPLMHGSIGSGSQSVILDTKNKSKGIGLWRKMVERLMNTYVLPANVEFKYQERDISEEAEVATVKFTRAETRAAMVASGEIDAEAARELAVIDGDIPEDIAVALGERAVVEQQIRDDERAKVMSEMVKGGMPTKPPAKPPAAAGPKAPQSDSGQVAGATGGKALRADFHEEVSASEDEAAGAIHDALQKSFATLRKHLAQVE